MSEDPLARAMRRGERFGAIARAFVSGERFEEFTVERRRVGRLVVTSNRLVVCDPFSLGFGFSALERKVPRGQFPVELSVGHLRKGKHKGRQVVAAVRVRFGEGEATGFRLAEVPDTKPTRLLGASFSGYAVESGVGCIVDADQAQAVADACAEAFAQGELDPEPNRDLRDELARPPADQRGWGSANLDGVHGSLIAFNTGWGDGVYPSYWGYDDERRLISLVTDFLVLPTDHELVRESWQGRSWREFVYEGDRGDRFWRIRIQGSKRTIQHGAVGRPGQTHEKDLQTSDKAFRSAARKILKQTEQGYVELTSDASRIRHRKSRRERKLAESEAQASRRERKKRQATRASGEAPAARKGKPTSARSARGKRASGRSERAGGRSSRSKRRR